MQHPTTLEFIATLCLGLAILHTFSVNIFARWASRYREGSVGENFLHLLSEVEIVFGIWAGVFLASMLIMSGKAEMIKYLENLNFTEPAFVFVIMTVCATRPILDTAGRIIDLLSLILPLPRPVSFYIVALVIGPLLGSFITEPAAMTVTALILLERYFKQNIPMKLKYATIGLLFVNISIGGTLTTFAAPPVLMVAGVWDWDLMFMLSHFGWKGALACSLSTALIVGMFFKQLKKVPVVKGPSKSQVPFWVVLIHLMALFGIVATAHHIVVFAGIFLLFLGVVTVTQEYQKELHLRQALLVGFFLAGLVVLGSKQRWWLEPVLTSMQSLPLFLGAIGLTAITDNAALTYLGAQVPGLSDLSKYALVAGAVVGGGLTVIANAPNPAGFGILNPTFGKEGISPVKLFISALIPTLIAALCFWFL